MSDLERRVLAAIAAEPSLTRGEFQRRRAVLFLAAGAVTLLVFLSVGGVRPTGRPFILWAATATGSTVIAAVALALALGRGGSMLGRSGRALVAVALATPLALLLWKFSLSSEFAGMTVDWPDRPGFRCLFLALGTGLAPMAAFMSVWRGTAPAHPRLSGLAIGTANGALVWVLVDLWCPVAYFRHLLLGHVLPLVVFAGLGAAAGGLLAARPLRKNA
jgi:hypothetical protein